MRIDTGYSGVPLPNRKQGRPVSGASSASRASSGQSSESPERGEFDPYLAALHDIPEAAEQTAEAILSDLASFIGQ